MLLLLLLLICNVKSNSSRTQNANKPEPLYVISGTQSSSKQNSQYRNIQRIASLCLLFLYRKLISLSRSASPQSVSQPSTSQNRFSLMNSPLPTSCQAWNPTLRVSSSHFHPQYDVIYCLELLDITESVTVITFVISNYHNLYRIVMMMSMI